MASRHRTKAARAISRQQIVAAALSVAVFNDPEEQATRARLIERATEYLKKSRRRLFYATRPLPKEGFEGIDHAGNPWPIWWQISGIPVELSHHTTTKATGRRTCTAIVRDRALEPVGK